MGRTPCCNAQGLKKGAWTADEDQKLIAYINEHGEGGWRTLPQKAGLSRCGKSCRLRWANYLSPAIKRGQFSSDEERTIINLHATLGNRWSVIARHLPRRTDNEIKNYWNTNLKKRLTKMRDDPATHNPIGPTSSVSEHMIPVRPSPNQPNPSPSTSSRPISRSANFLNKVASQLVPAGRLETVHAIVSSNGSTCWTSTKDVNCNDDPDPDVVPKSRISESAKLLNKMATRLGSPRLEISKLKSILMPKSAEVGSSDFHNIEASECNLNSEQSTSSATSEHGWSSFDNLESLHSPDLLNDWQVFCSTASDCGDDGGGGGDVSDVNAESQMSGLHFEWNSNSVAGWDSHELFGNCQQEYTLFDNML